MRAPTQAFARRVAYDWHGGQSSPLYSFASTGCKVWSEEHRQGLYREIQKAIDWTNQYLADAVAAMANKGKFHKDEYAREPHRLKRLQEYVKGVKSETQRELPHYLPTENPTCCPHCGTRTEFNDYQKFQHHVCPAATCNYEFIIEE